MVPRSQTLAPSSVDFLQVRKREFFCILKNFSMKKVVLAFSGGLDTSFCIPYLKEQGYEVVTVTVNTGGFTASQLKDIAAKAKSLGAVNHYEIDAQAELYEKFASYLIKANYLKGGAYPACVGPERNVIAMETAKIAEQEKTNAVAHGSTGAGNDQVRFDLALRALIPNVEILAPIRDESLSREQEVEWLEAHGFHGDYIKSKYSINVGLLGTTIAGVETTGSEKELPDEVFPTVKSIEKTPDQPFEGTIDFKQGLPVAWNGKAMSGLEIIKALNAAAAEHGFGKDYHIGTTIIGIKARIAFEAPALKVLIKAHTELEKLVLTSKQIFWKNHLGTLYGDLVHEALYFEPLLRNIETFLDSASEGVEGTVGIRIHKGSLQITSIQSTHSLLKAKLGTYGEKMGAWSGEEAKGFCKLYGMESLNVYLMQNS
jgi:argininosuccinate synthase